MTNPAFAQGYGGASWELIPGLISILNSMTRPYRRQGSTEQSEHGKDAAGQGFEAVVPNPKIKLMDQVREALRLRHYSIRTERCYCDWIKPVHKFPKPIFRTGV